MGEVVLLGLLVALCSWTVSGGYIGLCSTGSLTARNGELRYDDNTAAEPPQACQCNMTANDGDVFVHFIATLHTSNYDNCAPYTGYRNFMTSFLVYSCPAPTPQVLDIELKQGHELGVSVLNDGRLSATFNISFIVQGGYDVQISCSAGLPGAILPFALVAGPAGAVDNPNDGAILAIVLIVLVVVLIFIGSYIKVRCRDHKRKKRRDRDKLDNSQATATTTGPEDNSAFEFTPKSSTNDLPRAANGYKPYPSHNPPYQPSTPHNPQAAITGFGIAPAHAGPYRPVDLHPYRPAQPIEQPLQFSSLPPPGYTQDTPSRPVQTPEEFDPQQPYYINRNAPLPNQQTPAPGGPPQSRSPDRGQPVRPYTPEPDPQRVLPSALPHPQDNRAFAPDEPGTPRTYNPDNRAPVQRPYSPVSRDSPRPFSPEDGATPRSGTPINRPSPVATPAPLPTMARAPSQASIPGSLSRAPSQASIPGSLARAPSQSSIPGSMARAPSQSSLSRAPILYAYPSPPDSPASSRAESMDSSFYSSSGPRRPEAYHTPPQNTPEGQLPRGPRASSMSPYVGTLSAAPERPADETTV